MNKFKNILNDITNGWAFLYTAIYGIVAFVLGLYTAIINYFSGIHRNFPFMVLYSSITLCGYIALISVIALIISRIHHKFSTICKILLYLCIFYFLSYWYINYSNFCLGDILLTIFYIGFGIPILFIVFIIPTFTLFVLDLKHKINSPKINFKNKYIPLCFIIYAIITLSKVFSILKKII